MLVITVVPRCHSYLGRTIHGFPPQADGTVKASPQEGDFQIRSQPCVQSVWYLQQWELTFNLWEATEGTAIVCIILTVIWIILTNSKRGFSCLVLEVWSDSLWILQRVLSVQVAELTCIIYNLGYIQKEHGSLRSENFIIQSISYKVISMHKGECKSDPAAP